MDKTVISFDKDVTGVVGPNGCGKSNIVDAIRWVMGEQSAKHLRGKLMEDVIFAGSESRTALSMASVELTFSTEGYQTPADYLNHAEISVCRRLYRTGESEYLINKTPVRLKDVTDLFLGTGVGVKAYSVIEQGRIHQIVTAKPEERRYYIEEVAGISKFKSRKEAALRKVEATQQNMLRLTDILTEIERQTRSLDRQAKKAEKYRAIKTLFRSWDLKLSSHLYHQGQGEQTTFESQLRHWGDEESRLKTTLQAKENELEVLKVLLLEKEKTNQDTQNTLFEITNLIRLAEASLQFKKEEKARLGKLQEQIGESIQEIHHETGGVTNGLGQVNEQIVVADFELETFKEQVAQMDAQMQTVAADLAGLRLNESDLHQRINQAGNRLAQIGAITEGHSQKRRDLEQRIVQNQQELDEHVSHYKKIQKIYAETQELVQSLKQLKLDLTSKTDELAGDLQSHRRDLTEHQQELAKLKEEFTVKKSRLTSLQELQNNFEGYQEGTRSVLLKKQEIAGERIFGTVADFVETSPEYEGAVSAVLGEKLHYVVVQSQHEGVQALDYLQSSSGGRTSFIPLEIREHQAEEGRVQNQAGVLGPLKNFVNLKADYVKLESFLFGDVVLVADLKKALDVWASNGHRQTLVTLGGELIDPSGVITGGSRGATSRALLEQKREMKELSGLIQKLEQDLLEKTLQVDGLAHKVTSLEVALESVKTTSVEEEIKISNQEKDLSHSKKEIDANLLKQQDLNDRMQKERDSWQSLAAENKSLADEALQLKASLQSWSGRLEDRKNHLKQTAEQHDDLGQELTQKKIMLAQAMERRSHLGQELERLMQEKIALRVDLVGQEQELALAFDRHEFLVGEVAHIEKVLLKRLTKEEGIKKAAAVLKQAYDQTGNQIREIEQDLKEVREDLAVASDRLGKVMVSLTELRSQLKHLTEQCLERHQLSLNEVYQEYFAADLDVAEARQQVAEQKDELARLGNVNTEALEEYEELQKRFEFMNRQKVDLEASLHALERVINKINKTTKERFLTTFEMVNERFKVLFPKLFRGGHARLVLTDENNLLETGVEIIAQPPGKKLQSISLLSGGEKAFTAVSLVFAIFQIKPSPFCILDEVDAPLDDANVSRYNDMIREMTTRTQFVLITHNKKTMEMTDVLYGVTMQEPGVSQIVSVAFEEAAEHAA